MSEYEIERDAANKAMSNAIVGRDQFWNRADSLALAQVHATLAVAAATKGEPEIDWFVVRGDENGFTGSERADEVGA